MTQTNPVYAQRQAVINAITNGAATRDQIESQSGLSAYYVRETLSDLCKLGLVTQTKVSPRVIRYSLYK